MMTIFYMRSSGKIKVCLTGEYGMEFFGEEEEDYALIYGYIHVPEDEFVIRNLLDHKILNGEVVFTRIV